MSAAIGTPRRWPWVGAFTLVGFSIAGLVAAAIDRTGGGLGLVETISVVVLLFTFLGTGAALLSQRPRNAVSWLLPLPGVFLALDTGVDAIQAFVPASIDAWLEWFAQTSWAWTFPTLAVFLPLVFPNGAPTTPRWRWVTWTGGLGVALLTVGNAVSPLLLQPQGSALPPMAFQPAANPVAIDQAVADTIGGVGWVLFIIAFAAAATSAVVRYRRSVGVERQQLRWFMLGMVGVPPSWALAGALESSKYAAIGGLVLGFSLALLPVAVAMAVLRHRLYDIDRIVSRTVSYAILTAVLIGVYALGVLGIGALLPGEPNDLLVAGSTLAVAALFRPLRTRLQKTVDRRFNRARYDTARTVEAFAARLRDEVDVDALQDELREIVGSTFGSSHVDTWLPREATT